MSSGIYHRRWANATSTDGRNSATVRHSENVTQAIEPHTYGTSWNSVRWNKPLENGGRTGGGGYCSRSMPFFESISKDYEAKPAYSLSPSRRFGSQLASKNNTELKNSGPYGRERSVCFGGAALSLINDKASNRTSRLSWLSDNCSLASRRNNFFSKATRNSRENNAFTANSKCMPAAPSATRSFPSEVRKATPASSSSSSVSKLLHDKLLLGDKAQVISGSSINGSAAVKTDRPWRRRMADAARLRDAHGDEIGGAVNSTLMAIRARRSNVPNGRSATNNSGNELRTSLNALKNYIDEQTTNFHRQNNRFAARDTDKLSLDNSLKQHTPSWVLSSTRWNSGRVAGHMSRSYSPVRPRPSACNNMKLSKYNSVSTDMLLGPLRPSRQASANDACKNDKSYVLGQVIHNSPVPETVCERESVGRLLSSKERTLRHQLRLHKLGVESNSSSSDIEQQQTEERKWKPRKRLRKKSNSESKSESKQLLTGAEEAMTDSISVGMDIRKESAAAEVEEMERNQIFHSSQFVPFSFLTATVLTSCSITFPVVCTGRSELTVRSDQELKKIDKERKDGVIKKGLQLIVKKKKKEKRNLREKCDRATSSTDREKEVTRGIVGQSSDNKCMECNEMSRGMPKMLKNDVELMDGGERRCSDRRLSASLLSPITLNSARRNTAMSTSIDNHFEANGKPHDGAAQFDSSGS
ncbi:unnamed protein product [Litomosoides sigmodontis]|uniref:Uncharacterized protein n=1 Tax=Litomosoides sigmodontis TaxID=42156 RepID=A0A3P7JM90_LITSI|nr:unnamed protein product [Litomosoides sigmodontis]